ncbi:MAG: hypothetical protein ONB05_01500, partial [candidate division KSB1 bacterium]|nr:hypothetical protein [candidate division KSB1 bacterium]
MTKKKHKKAGPPSPKKVSQKPPFFSQHPGWLTVILILVLLLIFYHEVVFEGKTLLAPDALNSLSYRPFIKDALQRGIYPLWLPYIFSGMPSFASLASAPYINIFDGLINGILGAIRKVVPLTEFAHILVNYLLFGCLIYLLLRTRKASVEAGLFAAIAVIFMPQFIAFSAFGHNTKLLSTVLIPLIFLLVDQLLEKRNLLFLALTALAIGFQLLRAHVQV